MQKNINQLRFLILLAVLGVSVYIITQLPLNLGLDLQGTQGVVVASVVGPDPSQVELDMELTIGVGLAVAFNPLTSYFTSTRRPPVKEIVKSTATGPTGVHVFRLPSSAPTK